MSEQRCHRSWRAYRALPLLLGLLVFILPTPQVAVHLAKSLLLVVILAINARWGEPRVGYALILFVVVMGISLIPALHLWSPLVVSAIGFTMVAYFRPRWLGSAHWLLRGQASRATWVLAALTIPLSAGALVGWAHIAQPDLSIYADMIPGSGIGMVLAAALVFSLFNALAEEMAFRGVIWQALADTGFGVGAVLVIQTLAFGVWHVGGVPGGLPGMGLAALYALALGGIRLLSQGLLMPVIVHVFADLTIFLMVMRLAESG